MPSPLRRWVKVTLIAAGVLLWWATLDYFIAQPIPNIDVSMDPRYAPVVGERFRTQADMIAIGVTTDRNYKKQIAYVMLAVPPGFSGPEVVATGRLPKGALLLVIGVLKADSWFLNRIEYVVQRLDDNPPLDGTMIIGVDEESQQNFGLPQSGYRHVKDGA